MHNKCGGYYDWTEECRMPGCSKCSTIHLDGLPEKGCTCSAEIAECGYVHQTTLTRSETCPLHGRCRCGNSELKYDDHKEQDYWDREWQPGCPLIGHLDYYVALGPTMKPVATASTREKCKDKAIMAGCSAPTIVAKSYLQPTA